MTDYYFNRRLFYLFHVCIESNRFESWQVRSNDVCSAYLLNAFLFPLRNVYMLGSEMSFHGTLDLGAENSAVTTIFFHPRK